MLKKLGFDSFWILDQLLQIPLVGRPGEPMLESWSTLSLFAGLIAAWNKQESLA